MEKRKETENDQRRDSSAGNRDQTRETGSCEGQETVDDCGNKSSSVDPTSGGQDAPCTDSRHDEGEINLSQLTSFLDGLKLEKGASQTSNPELDLDWKHETEETEDCPEGAVGGSREGISETKATVSNDSPNAKDTDGDDDDVEGENVKEEEMKTCFSCGKKRQTMKKCGSCRHATYCDTRCQKADWKTRHKKSCRTYKRFLAQSSNLDLLAHQLRHGPLQIRMSMEFIKDKMEKLLESAFFPYRRPKQFVLLEVVDRHPHLFRPGCIVQDIHGNRTQILFYTDSFNVLVNPFLLPIPLEHFLEPGKFIWLVDPVWHNFLDGTVGIRINHPDEFELL